MCLPAKVIYCSFRVGSVNSLFNEGSTTLHDPEWVVFNSGQDDEARYSVDWFQSTAVEESGQAQALTNSSTSNWSSGYANKSYISGSETYSYTTFPKDEQYETTLAGKNKKVKTTGDKWMVLQANTYGTNSQPYYVFLNNEEEQLIEPANYQDYGTVELFLDWLNRGIKEYKK